MKEQYDVKSDRYGHVHKFVRREDGLYDFVPEQDWMTIQVTGGKDDPPIFIDTCGGPVLRMGWYNEEIRVVGITADLHFKLEEMKGLENVM